MKKAVVIGGTGMVGVQLIKLLIETDAFSEIVSLVRRSSGVKHPKLNEHIIDFDKPETWGQWVTGDVLVSTLGTTLAKAKSKDNQYRIDFEYQYVTAQLAAKNGIASYVLVSSAGASSKSTIFYSQMKGKLEDSVSLLPFKTISVLRPGQLDGERTEKRAGEKAGLSVMYFMNKLGLLKRYRPIQAEQVARAMINAARKTESASYTLAEMHKLAE